MAPKYHVGTMIELPRAALRAGEIAQEAQFFSFGTNDLTQTALGISRDDAARFSRPTSRSSAAGRPLREHRPGGRRRTRQDRLLSARGRRGRTSALACAANMAAIPPPSPSSRRLGSICVLLALPRAHRPPRRAQAALGKRDDATK